MISPTWNLLDRSLPCFRLLPLSLACYPLLATHTAMSDEAAKAQSVALKEQGNAAYKLRNFDQAEKLYQQAHEVYQDPTYLNNLAGRSASSFWRTRPPLPVKKKRRKEGTRGRGGGEARSTATQGCN